MQNSEDAMIAEGEGIKMPNKFPLSYPILSLYGWQKFWMLFRKKAYDFSKADAACNKSFAIMREREAKEKGEDFDKERAILIDILSSMFIISFLGKLFTS